MVCGSHGVYRDHCTRTAGTSNFTNASEWAWHVESRAWYAEVTGYTATTVHVHFGPLLAGGVRAVVTARVK